MAKISDLAVVQALEGDESLPMVQNGVTRRVNFRAMAASMLPFLPVAFKGDPGAAGNVASNLVQLKRAPIESDTMLWAGVLFRWETERAPYTADEASPYVTTVKSVHQPLTVGAWVRQNADGTNFDGRSVAAKLRDSLSVRDAQFAGGAKGDGVTDDTAAFLACYQACVAQKKAMRVPAGDYRAWLVVTEPGFVILGDGSGCTRMKVPDGATHTLFARDYIPQVKSGVPCVIDFGQIGDSNGTPARSGGHISGLTLDGNRGATAVPTSDLFGWGLAFTAWSQVTYHDIVATNCHCGGVGTFINSNHHIGKCTVYNNGKSLIDNAYRPNFDVNSSKFSVWEVVSYDAPYGVRLLDNCRHNVVNAAIENIGITGFVLFNQSVNLGSWGNHITATITGGCSDYAFTMGPKCFRNYVTVLAENISGSVWRDVSDGTPSHDPRANKVTIVAGNVQRSAVETYGRDNDFDIIADMVNQIGPQGVDYAVNVYGADNRFRLRLIDVAPWKSRGLAFRAGSSRNELIEYSPGITGDPYSDAGSGNVYRHYVRGQKAYDPPSLANGTADVTTVSCPGAAFGMFAQVSFSLPLRGLQMSAYVANDDVVQVVVQNQTGGVVDLGAGTLKVVAQPV